MLMRLLTDVQSWFGTPTMTQPYVVRVTRETETVWSIEVDDPAGADAYAAELQTRLDTLGPAKFLDSLPAAD